jgi:beta-barrel assembly-enhancing protease
MEAPKAIYRRNAYEAEREVKLMIYQDAFQLYDVHTLAFLESLPLKKISHLTEKNEEVTIHFKENEDIKIILEDDHPLLPDVRKLQKKTWIKPGGKVAILTAIVIVGIIFLNVIFSSLVADVGLKLITPEYEAKLGDEMFQSAIPSTSVDGKRTAMIQSFANKLRLSDKYKIQVTVVKSDDINAFAIPGGNIVVYSGLIEKMEHYEELAALLGHEASHINERHTTRAFLKELSSKLFLIFFMDVSQVGAILLLNADKLRSLSYSRGLEKEADEKGLNILLRNKINVNGMVQLFETLQKADTAYDTPDILNTHPLTEKRIQYTKDNIRKASQRDAVVNAELQQLWMNIKTNKFPGEDQLPDAGW